MMKIAAIYTNIDNTLKGEKNLFFMTK